MLFSAWGTEKKNAGLSFVRGVSRDVARAPQVWYLPFEVLILDCQTCFKNFSSWNCLTSEFCFPKRYIFRKRKRTVVMDAHP